MEEWKVIEEFPNYSVSNTMKVRNNRTGRILRQQYGAVSLSDAKKHMKARRGVLSLVLKYFEGFPREEGYWKLGKSSMDTRHCVQR